MPPPLCTWVKNGTIWPFFRALFPSTWSTLCPFFCYQDLGHTRTPTICRTFVLSLLVSGSFLSQNANFSWQARDCQIVPVLPSSSPPLFNGIEVQNPQRCCALLWVFFLGRFPRVAPPVATQRHCWHAQVPQVTCNRCVRRNMDDGSTSLSCTARSNRKGGTAQRGTVNYICGRASDATVHSGHVLKVFYI